jgi:hypothetical protein
MPLMRLVAILMLAAAAAGAGDDPARVLRGSWRLDKAAVAELDPSYATASPARQKEMREHFVRGMPDATVEFAEKDVTYSFAGAPSETSAYRVVSRKGNRLELEILGTNDRGEKTVDKTTAEILGPDRVRLIPEDGPMRLVLQRVK